MLKLNEVLDLYKSEQIDDFLKKLTEINLNEKRLYLKDIQKNYKFLGDNYSNASPITILKKGEKGLIERLTNGIDAVIEKKKQLLNLTSPKDANAVISKAYPKFYNHMQKISTNLDDSLRSNAYEAEDQVILAANEGSSTAKPTFDIIDKGTGVKGSDFANTLLSLNKGNKLSSEKKYLIGAFGQGGSTSLPFTDSTIIISKQEGKYYFTIIRPVQLQDFKNQSYVYLTVNDQIPELEFDNVKLNSYLDEFIETDSGTLVRMIETDISREYRINDITKPHMLIDYINTELFNVGLPIKIVENRKNYESNIKKQNRYAYGTLTKLRTFKKYIQDEYSGTINMEHNNMPYKIDYYVILPSDKADWGSDSKARDTFEMFNIYGDPIIYTVNGQTITTETFTRLRNNGLTFLRYRLLIVINLDNLGDEKYRFFTSDRNQIKDTDLTKGFIDKVVKTIASVEKLKEINETIADLSINSNVDNELLQEITDEVQDLYTRFLKGGNTVFRKRGGHSTSNPNPPDFLDRILELKITSEKRVFYSDEQVNFILTTGAAKYVNEQAIIYAYVDSKNFTEYIPNYMNGRISYHFNNKSIKVGKHTIQFMYFDDNNNSLTSETIEFEVLNDKSPEQPEKPKNLGLDIEIHQVKERELICEISKNLDEKKIDIYMCLEKDSMLEVYGAKASADDVREAQKKMIKPIALFTLFLEDGYDKLSSDDERNKLIVSFVKALLPSLSQ